MGGLQGGSQAGVWQPGLEPSWCWGLSPFQLHTALPGEVGSSGPCHLHFLCQGSGGGLLFWGIQDSMQVTRMGSDWLQRGAQQVRVRLESEEQRSLEGPGVLREFTAGESHPLVLLLRTVTSEARPVGSWNVCHSECLSM